jgi:hypothetical protein
MYILLDTKIRCQKLEVNNLNSMRLGIYKNSTNEETLIFALINLSTARNALEDIRVLISKLEKDNELLIKEINSKKETIKKLTSRIGN